MNPEHANRFDDFFVDGLYVSLKNLLYNYLLRKQAIGRFLKTDRKGFLLEVGSGLSPMVTHSDHVVYSDLSFEALKTLKRSQDRGLFVAADGTRLPFKKGAFVQVICSEVLEHLSEDRRALGEMAEVLKTGSSLILTFPHRQDYFACDDRFVNHLRRYELREMEERLMDAGLNPVETRKVLGPLEKLTMVIVVSIVSGLQRLRRGGKNVEETHAAWRIFAHLFKWCNLFYSVLVWLDARLVPRFLAVVLLIKAVKR